MILDNITVLSKYCSGKVKYLKFRAIKYSSVIKILSKSPDFTLLLIDIRAPLKFLPITISELFASFYDENVPVKEGMATAIISGLPVGTNTVPVTYSGDDKYNTIENTADIIINEKPVPAKENLTIKATADEITEGENATGNVSASVNGKTYTAPIITVKKRLQFQD